MKRDNINQWNIGFGKITTPHDKDRTTRIKPLPYHTLLLFYGHASLTLSTRTIQRSLIGFGSIYIGVLLNIIFAFGLQVLLARQLAPNDYGLLASTLATITLLAALANAGVPGFWLRMFGAENQRAIRWLNVSLKLLIISLCCFTITLWLWAYWGPHSALNTHVFFLLSPLLIGHVTIDLMTAKLQLEERYALLGIWQLIQNTLRFIGVLILVLIFKEIDIKAVALTFVMTTIIYIAFAFKPLLNLFKGIITLPQPTSLSTSSRPKTPVKLNNIAIQSFPFAMSGLLYIVYFQSDIILLNYLDSSVSAGIYNIAFTVMAAVYLFPNIFYQKFLLPKLHRWKAHDHEKLESTYQLGNSLMLVSGLVIMVLLWLLSPWVIKNVFGDEYKSAIIYLNILAVCAPLRFLSSSIASILLNHNEMKWKVMCMAVVATINVLLNLLFIPAWGAIGASITTVISESLLLVLFLFAANKHRKLEASHY